MPTKNVNLSDQQDRFISKSVKRGHYRNASEVVRAGLRLLEQQQAEDELKLHRLKQLATDAFASIDRGQHVTVAVGEIDAYLDSLANKSQAPRRK